MFIWALQNIYIWDHLVLEGDDFQGGALHFSPHLQGDKHIFTKFMGI